MIIGIDIGIASPCGVTFVEADTGQAIRSAEIEQPYKKATTDEKVIIMAVSVVDHIKDTLRELQARVALIGLEYAPFMQNRKTYADMSRLAGCLIGMLHSEGYPFIKVTVGEGRAAMGMGLRGTTKDQVIRFINASTMLCLADDQEHAADSCGVAFATLGKYRQQLQQMEVLKQTGAIPPSPLKRQRPARPQRAKYSR